MMLLRSILPVIALLALFGATPSARAAEQGVAPPVLAEVTAVRAQLYVTFNGRPLEVCHQTYIGTNRFYEICNQLADVAEQAIPDVDFPWAAGTVKEFIYYDGTIYERRNDEALWTMATDPEYDPNAGGSIVEALFTWAPEATLSRIGPAMIGGQEAIHYQYWTTDASFNEAHHGRVAYDQFVSPGGLVLHDQLNYFGDFPGLGAGQLSAIWTYTDHNSHAITITPPPADRIQQ
jgi:hypothetical protein